MKGMRTKWASRIAVAACIGALACVASYGSMSNVYSLSDHSDADGLPSDHQRKIPLDPDYPGCVYLCWARFWADANAGVVVAALAREPAARSYLGHVLRLAVTSGGSAGAVKELLRAGAPPNARLDPCPRQGCGSRYDQGDGRFVLHEASRRDAQVVSVLLNAGAFPHLADEAGRTPLHDAVEAGLSDAVSLLMAAGADPRAPDTAGVTPVGLAGELGDDEVLAVLRTSRVSPPPCGRLCEPGFWRTATAKQVRVVLAQAGGARGRSPRGDTPLHVALAEGVGAKMMKLLLDHGADPNARNARDDTPLHVAARTPGGVAVVPILLERGAMLEAANAKGRTPLHVASERGATIDAMRVLLNAGAKPNTHAGQPTWDDAPAHTAWNLAARQSEGPDAMKLLLDHVAVEDVTPMALVIPLHSAAGWGHPETVALLLDRGVHPDASSTYGTTYGNPAIYSAAQNGNVATMHVLLTRGADPNPSPSSRFDNGRRQPLHEAVYHPEAVEVLLRFGADPNARTPWKRETPLHLAARDCLGASLDLLLSQGAKPHFKDIHGNTPLSYAIGWSHWTSERREECKKTIVTLVRHGADPDIPNSEGATPLDKAKERRLGDTIIRLLENARQSQ